MAYDMFIKIGDINGESTDARHKDWINVLTFQHGVSLPAGGVHTLGSGAGKASFTDFVITKQLDKATPRLALACATGQHIPSVEFELVNRQTDASVLKYTLTGCIISAVQTGGAEASDGRPVDRVSLTFSKIEWKYTPANRQGTKEPPTQVAWDVAQNK